MEHHKKVLKKLIKWGIKLITAVIGLSPVFTTLMLGGIVMAVFGKSSSTSSDRVTMRPNVSESDTAAYIWEFFIGNGYTETQTAADTADSEAEEKTMTGTIEEIKDFMFIVTDKDGNAYEFDFDADAKPDGLDQVEEGDQVQVTYTGEVSEVDPFTGTVISVEKQ